MGYDFRAWLNVQPDDKQYTFHDCTGNCAMGQYMTSRGEKWHFDLYNDHIKAVGEPHKVIRALSGSKTFGELKRAMETV